MKYRRVTIVGAFLLLSSTPAWSQVTRRISVGSTGGQGNDYSYEPTFHDQIRYIAFESFASNLVPGDTNGSSDCFVHDLDTGTTDLVSLATNGTHGNAHSFNPSISSDGRFVAFMSGSTNLVSQPTSGSGDIFVRDRRNGTTEIVSIATDGSMGNGPSLVPSISADGRFVAFQSEATSLIPGGLGYVFQILLRDRQLGTTEIVSVSTTGGAGNNSSYDPSISADGRFVAFLSLASNLVAGDTNGVADIFVRDRLTGTTERVSVASDGTQGDSGCEVLAAMTPDGRFVVFNSRASNLVPNDANGHADVFVRDRLHGTTERVSVASNGTEGNADSSAAINSISADGRFVVFFSGASNLVPGDVNGHLDVFVHDRLTGVTEIASVDSSGVQGNNDSGYTGTSISPDGRWVGFGSLASNLVPGDTNNSSDLFVHDRHPTGLTSLCAPGDAGVAMCPCSNPPSDPSHGCDNSSATGGARLLASGAAYVSIDSLVFTATGELPNATSIVMQGDAVIPNGVVFGQGVRCAGGTIKRLYTKTASAGSITAPQGADPSVSARSAALGDVISAGQSRWYLVYYRDPIVLGGCPASSTFNASQTVRIDWSL